MTGWTILGFLLIILAQDRIMGVFYEKRRTSYKAMMLIYLLACSIFICSALLLWAGPYDIIGSMIAFTVPTFIITLNYESLVIKRFAVAAYFYFAMFTSASFVTPFIILTYQFTSINIDPYSEVFGGLGVCFIVFLLRRFKNIKKGFIDSPKFWIPALFVPMTYLSLSIYESINMHDNNVTMLHIGVIFLATVFLTLFLYNTLSSMYEENLKATLQAKEADYYFTQCQLMQESVEKMKSLRHDIKLHLTTARDYTANNKASEATDYLNNLLGETDEIETFSETGNIAFDSIINFKLRNAANDNIKTNMRVFVPVSINIDVVDIITILGNLLENALAAVLNVPEKIINLSIECSKSTLVIKMENTFDGVVKYDEKGSIATRKDGGIHGYGLKNIQKSVEKYNGCINISHDDNIFSVIILLYIPFTAKT